MSEFFKRKTVLAVVLGTVFLLVTLFVGVFAFLNRDMPVMAGAAVIEPEEEPEDMLAAAAEPDEEPETAPTPTLFDAPTEMRGAFLTPGVDFLKTRDMSEPTLRAEIEQALENAKELEINSLIIDTAYEEQVIYQTKDAPALSADFDILAYILQAAEEQDFYTYTRFDTSLYSSSSRGSALMAIGAASSNRLADNLREFTETYAPNGILLDGYASQLAEDSYSTYLTSGGGIGFANFMRQSPTSTLRTASQAIRDTSPGTQVGLLADAVWENRSANEQGSETSATYTSLSSGHADTKSYVEKGYVDFVAVKAYTTTESESEPFEEVVRWWADVAISNDVPLYVVHATSKLYSGEAGWASSDQLIRQVDAVEGMSGARGSIFDNLQKVSAGSQTVAQDVKKVQAGEVQADQILAKLEVTRPSKSTFITSEPQETFAGASDPGSAVTINGKAIETDASGYFSVQYDLQPGLNTFVIEHKGQSLTYKITRHVEILKEVSPKGDINIQGGTTLTVTALAYEDAEVYATIGDNRIAMRLSSAAETEEERVGHYRTFTGTYKVPTAGTSSQDLGSLKVHAAYGGESASLLAGNVSVNQKTTQAKDGKAVRIVADQAQTYPPDTLSNIPDARYFPLPAGAMDYVASKELSYTKDNGETFTYRILASGLRVETKDIAAATNDSPGNNSISDLRVHSEGGFTYVTLQTAQKVTYSVQYTSSGIRFRFHNTTSVPADMSLGKNPLFTSATWSDQTLTLSFQRTGGFAGYRGYYNDAGNLVLRFNNPPSSISQARVAIDPGHGGGDRGASGFLSEYPESALNQAIARALASELEARGATVNLMTNGGVDGEQRKKAAEKWDADFFISIHNNSSQRASATGTEVYYFHPFSHLLATNASQAVSQGLSTNNRGAKASYYHVSLSPEMPSALIECGFVSNRGEYEKLLSGKYQQRIAVGIADALSATIKGTSSGGSSSGFESGVNVEQTATSSTQRPNTLYLPSSARVNVGRTTTLVPELDPAYATADLRWSSNDPDIATVSSGGRVTGVREGQAEITVSTEDGRHSDSCTVTVRSASSRSQSVTGIDLDQSYLQLAEGHSHTLRANVLPDDADNTGIRWRSSDSSVASVSQSGRVTAEAEGSATITVTTDDGNYKSTCTVVVGEGNGSLTELSSASEEGASGSVHNATALRTDLTDIQLTQGESIRLQVLNQLSQPISGRDLTWESDDRKVATVDTAGTVTAKHAGSTTITARYGRLDPVSFYITVD